MSHIRVSTNIDESEDSNIIEFKVKNLWIVGAIII